MGVLATIVIQRPGVWQEVGRLLESGSSLAGQPLGVNVSTVPRQEGAASFANRSPSLSLIQRPRTFPKLKGVRESHEELRRGQARPTLISEIRPHALAGNDRCPEEAHRAAFP